jgi:site-specific recombinase XerD
MPKPSPAPRYATPPSNRIGGHRTEDGAFEDLLDAYTNRLRYTQGRSISTVSTSARHLRDAYRYLAGPYPDVSGVDRFSAADLADLEDFIGHEGQRGIAGSTRHTTVYALRSLYAYLVDRHGLTFNPAKALKGPKSFARTPEYYTETEAMTLLEYAANQAERDPRRAVGYVAMITFFCTGIRVGELAGVRLAEIHLVERHIDVLGKGNKRREVPIDVTGAAVLGWYLDDIRPHLPGAETSDYVFINPKSHVTGRFAGQFASRSLEQLVNAFGKESGLPGRHFPHKLRHTFASLAIQRGMSAFTLQGILGHAHVSTTEIYVHMVDSDRAVEHDRVFGRRPLPLPPAVADRPGALASVDKWARTAAQLAELAGHRLQGESAHLPSVKDAAEQIAGPAGRPLVSIALTAALSTAAHIPTDFAALITEHGPAFIEALTAVSDAAAGEG